MNIASAVTKDCVSEKCAIMVHGGMTTLAYQVPTYDRHGNQMPTPAVNTTFYSAECRTCGQSWRVTSKGEELSVTPSSAAKPLSDRHAVGE